MVSKSQGAGELGCLCPSKSTHLETIAHKSCWGHQHLHPAGSPVGRIISTLTTRGSSKTAGERSRWTHPPPTLAPPPSVAPPAWRGLLGGSSVFPHQAGTAALVPHAPSPSGTPSILLSLSINSWDGYDFASFLPDHGAWVERKKRLLGAPPLCWALKSTISHQLLTITLRKGAIIFILQMS